jgi:purine-binding chemotaxis protein CheW
VRGSVVPVVDLRLKFGMTKTEQSVNTCIVVLEIVLDEETTILGALADSVQEVIELEPGQIEPAPKIGTHYKTEFIKGIGKRENIFIMILDIDKVFSSNELDMVHATERSPDEESKLDKESTEERRVAQG